MAEIRIKRVYEEPAPRDGLRVLVDRLWPRGVSKERAAIDWWARDLAPSTELRKWFHHEARLWPGFRERYLAELGQQGEALEQLRARCAEGPVTLVYSARDMERNQAMVLRELLEAD